MGSERALEQYEAIAAAASEAFVTIDERGVIQSVNPAVEGTFDYVPGGGSTFLFTLPKRGRRDP